MTEQIKRTMDALTHNRMNPHYVDTKAEVLPLVRSLLPEGCSVGVGGSMTLQETGVMELLRSGAYRFYDRYAPDLTPEQRNEVFREAAFADVFLCSSNAVTEQGELYNVDGHSNRIAALAFGPSRVVVIAGINKLVPDLPAAVRRVKEVAAPLNARRLHCDTYCNQAGHCLHPQGSMNEGCASPQRICRNALVSAMQEDPQRLHVILVGEALGY